MRDLKQWVELSHKLPGIGDINWLAVDFQALGRLDIELIKMRESRKDLVTPPETTQDKVTNLTEALRHEKEIHYSRLWLLSAYEIVRIFKELDNDSFNGVYQKYRRLRIPLAKYEKMGNSKIRSIAWPATSTIDSEPGWVLEDGYFITRNHLANELIDAVIKYAESEHKN